MFSWRIANTSEGAAQETGEITALSVQHVELTTNHHHLLKRNEIMDGLIMGSDIKNSLFSLHKTFFLLSDCLTN